VYVDIIKLIIMVQTEVNTLGKLQNIRF